MTKKKKLKKLYGENKNNTFLIYADENTLKIRIIDRKDVLSQKYVSLEEAKLINEDFVNEARKLIRFEKLWKDRVAEFDRRKKENRKWQNI